MSQQLILTRGIPASGKTTWAKNLMSSSRGQDFVNVNRDDLRAMMFPNHYNKDVYKPNKRRELMVTEAQFSIVTDAMEEGRSVIVSDTNLNPATVEKWKNHAHWLNDWVCDVEFSIKDFYIDLDEALDRNAKRDGGVPTDVIHRMYYQYIEQVLPDWKVEWVKDAPEAIIVDVDGTIANHEGVRSPYDSAKVGLDEPHWDVIQLVRMLAEHYKVIIMTGRDGSAKQATIDWLEDKEVPFDKVFIRAAGDARKDSIVKRELFDRHVRGRYNVKYVIDDRLQVVYMWRALGLRVLDVAGGAF